jgi:hypothetical protein
MFQTNFVEKMKTHILRSVTFFKKIVPFRRKLAKYRLVKTMLTLMDYGLYNLSVNIILTNPVL